MRLQRKCKVCGESFTAIKHTQYFCKRRCFKKDYYQRTKKRNAALKKLRPSYNCSVCGNRSEITFDPVKKDKLFSGLICPFCGIPHTVILTFEQRHSTEFVMGNAATVRFVISSAIISSV